MLRDTERMHTHSISNICVMVFHFFAKCSSLFCLSMRQVYGSKWTEVAMFVNIILFLCNLEIKTYFRYPVKRVKRSYNYLSF